MRSHKNLAFKLTIYTVFLSLTILSTVYAETITIGTSMSKNSLWGKMFQTWASSVKKKTRGKLKLQFHWDNHAGDEVKMVSKIRTGQLDGAAVTGVGLGKMYKPIHALQASGLSYDWQTLEKVRKTMRPKIKRDMKREGLYFAGFTYLGLSHLMSVKKIRKPSDLKMMKTYWLMSDQVISTLAQVLDFTPRPMSISAVSTSLSSGRINAFVSPSIMATQKQWTVHMKYVIDQPLGVGVGALVFSLKSLERLSLKNRKILKKSSTKLIKLLIKKTRKEEVKLFKRIKKKMTVTKLSRAEIKLWNTTFAQVRKE